MAKRKNTEKEKQQPKATVSSSFIATIKNYLDNFAKENELFAVKYANDKKSIEECCDYIIGEVQKMQVNGLSDDEVYYMARHYYEEDDLKVKSLPQGLKVVVNQHIELTPEEKIAAKEKALQDYKNAELKKLEEEAKKKAEKKMKAAEKAKKREEDKKAKIIEQTKSEQLDIFSMFGGD